MGTIASLDVDLALNSAKFIEGVRKARKEHEDFTKSLMEIGETANRLGEQLGGSVNADFTIRGMVEAARDAQESQAKLNAVLVATNEAAGIGAQGMKRIEDELTRFTTFGHEAARSAETILATFTHVRGDQFRQAMKAAADLASVFKIDLTDAARSLGSALENPGEGLRRLSKLGVQFSEAQKEVIKSLVETGDTAAAQQKILDAIHEKVGGSAEAMAKTAGGALKQLENEYKETAAVIGNAILPAVNALETGMNAISAATKAATSAMVTFKTVQSGVQSLGGIRGLLGIGGAGAVGVGLGLELFHAIDTAYETSAIVAEKAAEREERAHEEARLAAQRHAEALEKLAEAARKAAEDDAKLVAGLHGQVQGQFPLLTQLQETQRWLEFVRHNSKAAGDLGKDIETQRAKEIGATVSQQHDEMARQADSLKQSLMTPFDHFQSSIGELRKLFANDFLNPGQYAAGLKKAYADLARSSAAEPVASAALAQGSVAAYSAALENSRTQDNPQLDALNKQIDEAVKANGNLNDIKQALLGIDTPEQVSFN